MEVPHPCLNVIFEEVDDLAKALQESIWADGELHCSLFLGAGYLEDQPEHDTMCCEGSQTCKQCKCPKNRLHEARSEFEPRTGNEVEIAVKRAALQGRLPWDRGLPSHPPLFAQKRILPAAGFVGFLQQHAHLRSMKPVASALEECISSKMVCGDCRCMITWPRPTKTQCMGRSMAYRCK